MQYKILLQSEAVADLQIAFEWYEERKTGLGNSFLTEVNICLEKIRINPKHYGLTSKWVRKIKTNKFPFLIIFEIEGDSVIVNTVLHTSKKPKS